MVKKTRSSKRGAGYLSPAEFFNPSAHQPSSNAPAISSLPRNGWVRPPMAATSVVSPNTLTQKAGKRNNKTMKKMRGGFAPELMGALVSNAQAVVVPLVLYSMYRIFGTKESGSDNSAVVNNTRKNKRNNNKK
jgi:hypothetical protein